MRVFKIKHFAKWAKANAITDEALYRSAVEMSQGLIDADLGGGLVKKRIALPGMGKRGGARTLLATNYQNRWMYLIGFTKGEKDNISSLELAALKMLASDWLALNDQQIGAALLAVKLSEITLPP
jgi:hypothetical protein